MSRDSSYTYVHFHSSRLADLFEDFSKLQPPLEDIYVPLAHQPVNPEDEDDVVPDQHAAFGIQRATQARKTPAWKDLGLEELLRRGPREDEPPVSGSGGTGSGSGSGPGSGFSGRGGGGGGVGSNTRSQAASMGAVQASAAVRRMPR